MVRGELRDVADSAVAGIEDGKLTDGDSTDVAGALIRLSMDCRAEGARDLGQVPLPSLSRDACLLYAL